MLDFIRAIICTKQEYCTSCPSRKGCANRVNFYDEKNFFQTLDTSNSMADSMFVEMGFPKTIVTHTNTIFVEQMKRKRNKELEEHPTYSPF